MRILFIGDIMGKPGRKAVPRVLPSLRDEFGNFDFIIANGENSAAGFGLTETVMNELFSMGIDILTSGNHVWDKKDILPFLDSEKRILRPANHREGLLAAAAECLKNGRKLAVISLQGRTFMPPLDCPFRTAEKLIEKLNTSAIFVDFHAEASSEKGPCLLAGWKDICPCGNSHACADIGRAGSPGRHGIHIRRWHDRGSRRHNRDDSRICDA